MADPSFARMTLTRTRPLSCRAHMIGKLHEKRPRGHHISISPQVTTQNHHLHQIFPNLIYIWAECPEIRFLSLNVHARRGLGPPAPAPMPISGLDMVNVFARAVRTAVPASSGVTINSHRIFIFHSCHHNHRRPGQLLYYLWTTLASSLRGMQVSTCG